MNEFILNGVRSGAYGIIMTEPPPAVFPKRIVETVAVPGRSGTLILDSKSFANAALPYKCAILPEDDQTLREAAEAALMLLRPTAEYMRMECTYYPDSFRMARISNEISVESIVDEAGRFTIPFDCKPQRYLKSGEHPILMDAAGILCNPTLFPALPLITVYGSGAGELIVGDIVVQIKANDGHIVLDSEMQDAYRVADSGALENKNGSIYAPDFPQLPAGETAISWMGDIAHIEIIPRWWTL